MQNCQLFTLHRSNRGAGDRERSMSRSVIGPKIRDRRHASGSRSPGLAARVGISASYLNLIENNKRSIAGALLRRIGDELGLSLEDLDGAAERRLIGDLVEIGGAPPLAPLQLDGAAAGISRVAIRRGRVRWSRCIAPGAIAIRLWRAGRPAVAGPFPRRRGAQPADARGGAPLVVRDPRDDRGSRSGGAASFRGDHRRRERAARRRRAGARGVLRQGAHGHAADQSGRGGRRFPVRSEQLLSRARACRRCTARRAWRWTRVSRAGAGRLPAS